MSNPYTLIIREVYEDGGRHFLTVAPGSDGFGVDIRTTGEKNKEYFGDIRLCLEKRLATKLAQALLQRAMEIES